jgi:hypothetical protein
VKFWLGVGMAMLTLHPVTPDPATDLWLVYEQVEVPAPPVPTPIADSLVDWVEVERQTECLWTFILREGIELTGRNVLTAGDWTDMHGGACAMIGEDDE